MQKDYFGTKIIHEDGFTDFFCFDDKIKIAVIGLGYVGLPLFCQLSKIYSCIGYDIDSYRTSELAKGIDSRNSVEKKVLEDAISNNVLTNDINEISSCNFYIVTVPTPIDSHCMPNVSALENVCIALSSIIHKNSIIIFESTVYPGATEELCVPLLSKSGLMYNRDFYVGYSPERINVGDVEHQISKVPKIVSGSSSQITDLIGHVYQSVLDEPIVRASSIKVAEAAKMYENVQRDVLIALANEYSEYCRKEEIDIKEVTECASTKWNFSKVLPGLVGGHCIAVDPYYLIDKAIRKEIDLPIIKESRKMNELKSKIVANRIHDIMLDLTINSSNILFLGFAYKTNSADVRNTKVADVIKLLSKKGYLVDCFDPLVNKEEVRMVYGISLSSELPNMDNYGLVVVMVEHDNFQSYSLSEKYNDHTIIHLRDLL